MLIFQTKISILNKIMIRFKQNIKQNYNKI